MKTVRLTIKNYRGFSDSEPVTIELGAGLTALLGRNNVGKSSLKLFFYELRPVFEILARSERGIQPNFFSIFSSSLSATYQGITDTAELFNNTNERPITIEFELPDARANSSNAGDFLTKVIATCDRKNPQLWRFETYGKLHPRVNYSSGAIMALDSGLISHNTYNRMVDCSDFIDVMKAFRDARYYGPFRNAINEGSAQHFDLRIGTGFIDLWNEWKTSGVKSKTRAIDKVTEDIRRLFEFERLEINASLSLKTLIVMIDGHSYRLSELGSGLAQFIMVLGNAATTNPSLLLIDEPETNLHPTLQIDFLLSVVQYARDGCLFSTHSVGLARSVADRIYSFQKKSRHIFVKPFEAIPNYLEFVGELSFSTFKELGGDRLLLVEGVNDVKTVQQLLRTVKKEHATVILPLGGDQLAVGGREAELSELTRLSHNIFALVDSERTAADATPSVRRVQFRDLCKRIGINVCVTDRRAIENYFPDRAVKAAFGDNFGSLDAFQLLKDCAHPWPKSDSWKIARNMNKADLDGTDLGEFLARI